MQDRSVVIGSPGHRQVGHDAPHTSTGTSSAGVGVRTTVLSGQPLVVVALDHDAHAGVLGRAVESAGLPTIDGFLGQQLVRGARLGFVIDRGELRMVDESDTTVLRAPRTGLDTGWVDASLQRRGTMLVVADGVDLAPLDDPAVLAGHLDEVARSGRARGAIVGVVTPRATLPLALG